VSEEQQAKALILLAVLPQEGEQPAKAPESIERKGTSAEVEVQDN
jgi:hypothetical protein